MTFNLTNNAMRHSSARGNYMVFCVGVIIQKGWCTVLSPNPIRITWWQYINVHLRHYIRAI